MNEENASPSERTGELVKHHIVARSAGGTNRRNNILNLPRDFEIGIHQCMQKCIAKVKRTGRSVRDDHLLTLRLPTMSLSLNMISASDVKHAADDISEPSLSIPVVIYAGSVRTGATVKMHPLTIGVQLREKNRWGTQRYPREFEEVAPGTCGISGSPGGHSWFSYIWTQGSADYRLLRQL